MRKGQVMGMTRQIATYLFVLALVGAQAQDTRVPQEDSLVTEIVETGVSSTSNVGSPADLPDMPQSADESAPVAADGTPIPEGTTGSGTGVDEHLPHACDAKCGALCLTPADLAHKPVCKGCADCINHLSPADVHRPFWYVAGKLTFQDPDAVYNAPDAPATGSGHVRDYDVSVDDLHDAGVAEPPPLPDAAAAYSSSSYASSYSSYSSSPVWEPTVVHLNDPNNPVTEAAKEMGDASSKGETVQDGSRHDIDDNEYPSLDGETPDVEGGNNGNTAPLHQAEAAITASVEKSQVLRTFFA